MSGLFINQNKNLSQDLMTSLYETEEKIDFSKLKRGNFYDPFLDVIQNTQKKIVDNLKSLVGGDRDGEEGEEGEE